LVLITKVACFSVTYNCFGINLEYVTVKTWQRNASIEVQASNKMASQMNVETGNVTL